MCGIFSILNYDKSDITKDNLIKNFNKGINRGPEYSNLINIDNIYFGFHRLAINGLDSLSNQPFEDDNIILICNGEIYNYKQLAKENNINLNSNSDCEIILHLYKLHNIEYVLNILDGVFSFILYDKKTKYIYIARDPYGVRPLYYFSENNVIGFASELKVLYNLTYKKNNLHNFKPGHYLELNLNNKQMKIEYNMHKYIYFPCSNNQLTNTNLYNNIISFLITSVKKRVIDTTERPIACLLSGGLDSSLIAALVKYEMYKNKNLKDKKLKTFSIGLPGSEDLKYAKIVANHLNTEHHEIIVSEDDFFNAIPEVIRDIESYDTTTVRASVGNYLIGKYIKENTDCKVIFNGDGADELMGGYLYMKHAPNSCEFDKECKRLLNDIYMFDVLRSDKCISSHGLEPRTPYLDKTWVEFYLSINRETRYNTTINNCEKFLIRKSFDTLMPQILPKSILWRTKEAFSDGVSSQKKSWYEIIQDKIIYKMTDELNEIKKEDNELYNNLVKLMNRYKESNDNINIPITFEQAYYRYLYNINYINTDHLIEYFWMPKFINAKDASARTLNIYKNENSNIN